MGRHWLWGLCALIACKNGDLQKNAVARYRSCQDVFDPASPVIDPCAEAAGDEAPQDPAGVTLVARGPRSLALGWQAGDEATGAYRVAFALGTEPPADCGGRREQADPRVTVQDLRPLTTYSFRICAVGRGSVGLLSPGRVATFATGDFDAPEARDFRVDLWAEDAVTLAWMPASGVSQGHRLVFQAGTEAPPDCRGGQEVPLASREERRATVDRLRPASPYGFRLCSANRETDPRWSPGLVVRATTLPRILTVVYQEDDALRAKAGALARWSPMTALAAVPPLPAIPLDPVRQLALAEGGHALVLASRRGDAARTVGEGLWQGARAVLPTRDGHWLVVVPGTHRLVELDAETNDFAFVREWTSAHFGDLAAVDYCAADHAVYAAEGGARRLLRCPLGEDECREVGPLPAWLREPSALRVDPSRGDCALWVAYRAADGARIARLRADGTRADPDWFGVPFGTRIVRLDFPAEPMTEVGGRGP